MSAKEQLEKLQTKREELEAESRLLMEEQETLEKSVLALEEQIVSQKLKKEKALVEDLKIRNKAVKSIITELEAKKEELETKLSQITQTPEGSSEAQEISASHEQPEEVERAIETQEKHQKKRRFF
jgi:chromosome segregation ATPase